MDRFDKAVPFRPLIPGLLMALGLILAPAMGSAQIPPGEAWRTLDTEHFRITYPADLLDLAQRAGQRAETAWTALAEDFVDPPKKKVDLVLTDHADISNGYSRIFPSNRIVIYAPPPMDGFGLPHMDEWIELVVTHELAHIFHLDYSKKLSGFLRSVFGRVPLEWPFFPGAATPGWAVEGIATYYESELTQAGRVRGSFHEMVVRTAIFEDRFETIDQSSGESPVWPGGQRYYVYGSLFLKYLMDEYGPEAMGGFVEAVAGQWIPYRMNAAARDVFGISFTDSWEEWRTVLEGRYSLLRDSLEKRAPITQAEALTGEGYYAWSPEPSRDGRGFAFARSDGRSDPQIRFKDLGDGREEKLARTNNLTQFSWTPTGGILFSQIDYTDSYRLRGDLYLMGPEGDVTQLTKGSRLDHPDVAPEGDRAVAVQEGAGSNRLVMVDLSSGEVEPLGDFQEQELWSYPRWSPDGRLIAASRWRAGAYFDVVILTPEGEVLWDVTGDRGIDNAPAWSPDGHWLLWSSDRSGIPNLYAVPVDPASGEPGSMRQITNLLGGGAYPSVDPGGRWIYFSSYHADGWRVERIPFRPEDWFQPFPRDPNFQGQVDAARFEERVQAQGRSYNPLTTLLPTYWAPTYREGDNTGGIQVLNPGYGIFTSGEDLVGRHSYSLSGTFSSGAGTFNGLGSYTFGGLENPLLSVAAAQSYDAASQPWAGITEAGDTVPIFLVERERSLGFGAAIIRRRSRTETTLRLSAAHIWEDRFFLEENLQESERFRLGRPSVRLGEVRATLTFGNARRFPFSISAEDGVGAFIRARVRRDLTLADSLKDVAGSDRSFNDLIGHLSAYKGFRLPGFGNHVLGVRASGGVGSGPGADASHFEVGGASGSNLPIEFLAVGQGLLFPVRGYHTASRWGRYAWSGTVEYRFPITLVNRGAGLFPLHLDWISGALFLDGGNAWGPESDVHGFDSPRRDALASTGAEVLIRTLPLWFQSLDLRVGVAFPLVEEDGPRSYLRLGLSF
jgi:Tol biopolymer transport system component